MTFREFFNKRDSQPLTSAIKPPMETGLKVVKDLKKDNHLKFYTDPKAPKPYFPKQQPSLLPSHTPIKNRPIEGKPTDFLKRKSNPMRIKV